MILGLANAMFSKPTQSVLNSLTVITIVLTEMILIQTIKTESLPNCQPYAVCSVVHKRFWLTPIVRAFCKCQNTEGCAQRWHHNTDSRTMQLDSRSQLKFCDQITELPSCKAGQSAIRIQTETNEELGEETITAVAKCQCQWPTHWSLLRHSYRNYSNGTALSNNTYTCDYLSRCQTNDFCGNIRADTFSAYYQCYCPKGTLCLKKNRQQDYASELLYEGPVYKAVCSPFKVKLKGSQDYSRNYDTNKLLF